METQKPEWFKYHVDGDWYGGVEKAK